MDSIGLGEALSLWFSGQKLDGMAIWGVPTLLIARVAKVAVYVSALVVVLDIIGPERIREFGERVRKRPHEVVKRLDEGRTALVVSVAIIVGVTLAITVRSDWSAVFLLAVLVFIMASRSTKLVTAIGSMFARPRLAYTLRVGSFGLLTLASLADLLTS